jgi:hypothetical protein
MQAPSKRPLLPRSRKLHLARQPTLRTYLRYATGPVTTAALRNPSMLLRGSVARKMTRASSPFGRPRPRLSLLVLLRFAAAATRSGNRGRLRMSLAKMWRDCIPY